MHDEFELEQKLLLSRRFGVSLHGRRHRSLWNHPFGR